MPRPPRHGYRDRYVAFGHAEPLPTPELRLADGRQRIQLGRTLVEFGIRSIAARSSHATGSSERP